MNINNSISKEKYIILIMSLLACILILAIEGYIEPEYVLKSAIKLVVFFISILGYMKICGAYKILDQFKYMKFRDFKAILGLSIGVYFFIIILFFLLKDYIDLDVIRNNLLAKENITATNFVYVSLYISFVNSFLEELFFRGFMFLSLTKSGSRRFAYLISSLVFSLYHVAIISAWFNIWIFILIIVGLMFVGYIFNYITEKLDSFLASWIVHIFANLAINTIGFMMLGIINII